MAIWGSRNKQALPEEHEGGDRHPEMYMSWYNAVAREHLQLSPIVMHAADEGGVTMPSTHPPTHPESSEQPPPQESWGPYIPYGEQPSYLGRQHVLRQGDEHVNDRTIHGIDLNQVDEVDDFLVDSRPNDDNEEIQAGDDNEPPPVFFEVTRVA
ncbi:hypothetical protein PIB30_084651 [Stylosanthes scabra]|uniref:Uncharacterized protein n=1 Tax=Stylosanthes scabra TaxID=79078 RepID=A0ABU6RT05_9FABA|nr:hypothetical protein [Stylosanthes scabra]